MPRAKGSASAIRKRSSHITVVVSDGLTAAKLSVPKTETKKAEPKPADKPKAEKPAKKKEEAK
jgi:hypothetical protein